MSKQAPGPAIADGGDFCHPSRRNRYYRDKRMHVADYVVEQEYQIARRRLVNRAMLGWGVMWGFRIDPEALTVGRGLALDPQGRELVACDDLKIAYCEDLLWLGEKEGSCSGLTIVDPPKEPEPSSSKGRERDDESRPPLPESPQLYLLAAHYAEKRINHVRLDDGCGGVRCEANQVYETVVYSLRPIPCCEAGLPVCRCPRCAGEDKCACKEPEKPCDGDSDQKQRQAEAPQEQKKCFSLDRGNHRQLALWNLDPLEGFDACKRDKLAKVGCLELEIDPNAGVPLACVTIGFHCGEPRVTGIVDSAHPRRLARSNEVLFDLIRGCDLTRIKDVGWRDWLSPDKRVVPRSAFQKMFDPPAEGQPAPKQKQSRGTVVTHFTVDFTGPVRVKTLTPDVLTMSLIQRELREDVGDIVRVPIVKLNPDAHQADDPPETTRGFTVLVERSFWKGEISPDDASGFEYPTLVEIEIRTDWILDCNGQEVAGGGRYVPSTGCAPGGRFLSSFTVVPDDQIETGALPSPAGDKTQQEI